MEGEAISATIGVLVQNMITVSKDEISLIRGLEKNAEKLKETLVTIQTSLDDAQKKFVDDDAPVKRWLGDLEAVAFNADNALDELDYKIISKKMNTVRTPKNNRASCFPYFNRYIHRRQMALTIKEINTSFESIDKRATALGLERRLADAPAARDAPALQTDSFKVDPIFIGRDDVVSDIVQMLTTSTEEAVSVLPVVGMGGLGKTTLIRKVFNEEKIKAYFGLHIWVHVSQNFDAVNLLNKILINLNPENAEIGDREVLLKKLREALGAKTYLLILDDVWNQDKHKWEDFIGSWSGITSTKGNGIIVTTRNTQVGSIVNTLGILRLNGLSEDECWSIINGRAFNGGDIPVGIEAIGSSIAGRCQGLPLAANVVGGVLKDKSKDEWLSIKDNWLSEDTNNISRILRLSYDHLSSPSLKKCFAYCSVFPKGFPMKRKELIQLWMAEGFLQPSPTSDMENAGNKFFNLLVQSSLLQVVDRDQYNNVKHCSTHDLVHDVAASVLGISDYSSQARYIFWCNESGEEDESNCIPKEQTKWLRTLLYQGDIFENIIFADFKSLHVLVLAGFLDELPDSIGELIHLRLLDISRTFIKNLPDSIGELHHLQTFKANNWGLRKLPNTFKYLFKLRHLHVRRSTILSPYIGMLTSLQTFKHFRVLDEDGHRIEELGSLKNLKGKLRIENLERVQGEDESSKACLSQRSGIVKLWLKWNKSREGEINDESVLTGLKPHPNLKILNIIGFKGVNFPSWTLKMEGLNNLMEIRLEECLQCEEIPMLGQLPRLKSLYLLDLQNVKCISSSFYGINGAYKETIIVFPTLEKLELFNMPNLTAWAEVPCGGDVKAFPCLEYLKIKKCKQLKSAPSQFPCLKVLKIDQVDSGKQLFDICGINLTSLVQLKISRVGEIVSLPDWLFHNNQNLSVLKIQFCHELRELPDGLQTLKWLKELTILGCENVESIPLSSLGQSCDFKLLRRLSIGSATNTNFPCEMVESCASSLEELKLWRPVTDIPMVVQHMHKMHGLTELELKSVPKFIISSPIELGSLRSLKTLNFSPDSGSWDSVSFNKAADEILQLAPRSLLNLDLRGCEDWESLPDQLQHLTSLSKLKLGGFGIQELPEWFGNLSSLEVLKLYDCNRLKRQRFLEVMQHHTNLMSLRIKECPLLEEGDIEEEINEMNYMRVKINDGRRELIDEPFGVDSLNMQQK